MQGQDETAADCLNNYLAVPSLTRLTLGCWAAWLLNAAVFFTIWRFSWSPHAVWGILSCLSAGGLTFAAVLVGLCRIVVGPKRWRSLGYLLLALAPLFWFASHVWELSINAKRRNDLKLGAIDRVTVTWILSIAEVEARWRLPQWVHGRHVTMVDDGHATDAQELVAAADEHVERMANQLGKSVPAGRIYWIRREILGQRGRAIGNFAFCNHGDQYPTALTDLDRHELAHTLITVLSGPDNNPPALLKEGWAQVHSRAPSETVTHRNATIRNLAEKKREEQAYSLDMLVAPGWYGAGRGPAYNHGEPLAFYLLERFGGKRFLEFYSGVERYSFSADCRRILGLSWGTLVDEFWQWIEAENMRLAAEEATQQREPAVSELSLADGVSPADWQVFVEGYRTANSNSSSSPPSPNNFCFEMSSRATRTLDRDGSATEAVTSSTLTAAFTNDSFWAHCISDGADDAYEAFYWCTPSASAHFYGKNSQSLKGRVRQYDNSLQLRQSLGNSFLWSYYGGEYDPARTIPGLAKRAAPNVSKKITKLLRPTENDSQPWVVEIQYQTTEKETNQVVDNLQRLTVDPTSRWWVSDSYWEASTGESYECRAELNHLAHEIIPIAVEQHYRSSDYKAEITTTLRQLSESEIESLKQRVGEQVRRSLWRDPLRWIFLLKCLMLGLPVISLLLVLMC